MNKPLLLIAIIGIVVGIVLTRNRVREAENDAALWAEATDAID